MLVHRSSLRTAAIGAAAALALAALFAAAKGDAEALRRGFGPGIAAGVIGGLALGALAARPYHYGHPGYYNGTAYRDSGPAYHAGAYGSDCSIERRDYVNRFGHWVAPRLHACD